MDGRLAWYARYVWRSSVRHEVGPLIYGIALTDRCNLACRGCRVSNTGRPDMTWEQLVGTAAPPARAASASCTLPAASQCCGATASARSRMPSRGARASASSTSTSTRTARSGSTRRPTWSGSAWTGCPAPSSAAGAITSTGSSAAVRERRASKIAVIYVIDRNTADGIEPFLRWVRDSALPGHRRHVLLPHALLRPRRALPDAEERAPIIDRLLDCIRAGLPVLNSRAGLRRSSPATGRGGRR